MTKRSIYEVIKHTKEEARKLFERRLFIILGEEDINDIFKAFIEMKDEKTIIVSDREIIREHMGENRDFTYMTHKETKRILGMTFDNAIIDLMDFPDVISLSRVIGSIRGGGLIFLLMPITYLTSKKYIERLQPVGISEHPRDLLRRRILIKALESDGILLYSTYSKSFIKTHKNTNISYTPTEENKLRYPTEKIFPIKLYEMCLTQDQINALNALEKINSKSHILITADRGRGKSSVIGIGLTGIGYNSEELLSVIISSPEKENVLELFNFLKNSHDKLGITYRFDEKSLVFKSPIIKAAYKNPFDVMHSEADLLVIDEAAGLPFPLLVEFLNKFSKIIFSTTIHGYEGTGRSFSVRFMSLLRNKNPSFLWIKLKRPIRYANNDPVEKWLFSSLMLDAEPDEIIKDELAGQIDNTHLINHNPFKLLFNDNKLKSLFGILVAAHYRNNPNDLLMLGDAPHHKVFSLNFKDKILVAIQISKEGDIRDKDFHIFYKESPSSHIIPDKLFKYYGIIDFLHTKGWRIVRIATHPNLTRIGLGSRALQLLEEIAINEQISWIGAGFSAYPELLRFWIKNGYLPVHMSPKVNRKTGEHTIIVVKPLDSKTTEIIEQVHINLKLRLLDEAATTYRNLNPASLRIIIRSGPSIPNFRLKLDSMKVFRLNLYLQELLHFESASDAITEIVKYYFAKKMNALNKNNEELLISAVLQRKRVGLDNLLKVRKLLNYLWKYINTSAI